MEFTGILNRSEIKIRYRLLVPTTEETIKQSLMVLQFRVYRDSETDDHCGTSRPQRENFLLSFRPLLTCLKILDFCTFLDFWYPNPPPPPRFCIFTPLLLWTSEEEEWVKENTEHSEDQ